MCTACSLWPHEEDWSIVHPFLERAAQRLGELRDQPVATDEVAFVVRALAIDPLELVPEVIGERIPIEPLEPIPIRPPAPPSPAPRVRPVVQFAFDGSIMGQLCQPIYCTCGRLVRK
jgi:hypothetical protein